ncbi:hypothetical protein Trydic_g17201 [Trypoxylus dichotomus]
MIPDRRLTFSEYLKRARDRTIDRISQLYPILSNLLLNPKTDVNPPQLTGPQGVSRQIEQENLLENRLQRESDYENGSHPEQPNTRQLLSTSNSYNLTETHRMRQDIRKGVETARKEETAERWVYTGVELELEKDTRNCPDDEDVPSATCTMDM